MSEFHYIAFDEGWDEDLGDQAVRIEAVTGFTECFELGAVGASNVVIDDPSGTAGHASDGIIGLQQLSYDDSRASDNVVFRGWTKPRRYYRGASLVTGVARQIEVALADGNDLAGRRSMWPKDVDPSVNRPAETPTERIAWLLSTDYFSGVVDSGLVSPGSGTLTPNDYSNQAPADVLNDCSVLTGDNWSVYWDRTAAAWSLAVYNFTTSFLNAGSLILSNDPALVDSNVRDGAGVTNTWDVYGEVLETSPDQVATELITPFAKGTDIQTSTSTRFPVVTKIAPTTSVKTAAAAAIQGARILADLAFETDRITCSARISAANVNDAMAGQLIFASFTHYPAYATLSYFRIARRTVALVGSTDDSYVVTYELIPAEPVSPTSSFARIDHDVQDHNPHNAPTSALINWQHDGDAPQAGWIAAPKFGLMAYDDTGAVVAGYHTGIKMNGGGTVNVSACASFQFVYGSSGAASVTLTVMNGATTLATVTVNDTGTGAHNFVARMTATGSGTVVSGDILTAHMNWTRTPAIGVIPNAAVFVPEWFSAEGDLT